LYTDVSWVFDCYPPPPRRTPPPPPPHSRFLFPSLFPNINPKPPLALAVKKAGLSVSAASDLCESLVKEGWLTMARPDANIGLRANTAYELGPRVFLELGAFVLSLDLPEGRKQEWEKVL
jgi:hypothetical protein